MLIGFLILFALNKRLIGEIIIMSKYNSIFINSINVKSSHKPLSTVTFDKSVKFITGASNTGKSFLISLIDYMLGKSELMENEEVKEYQTCFMHFTIGGDKYTSFRDISSDRFFIYTGFVFDKKKEAFLVECKTGNSSGKVRNISLFLFEKLGLEDVYICRNLNAEKEKLSMRTLSKVFFAYEKEMIDELSPILVEDKSDKTKFRNIFSFLLTGMDGKDFNTIKKRKEFNSEKSGKISAFSELVEELKVERNFPEESYSELIDRQERIQNSISKEKEKIKKITEKLDGIITKRKECVISLEKASFRLRNTNVNILNFNSLADFYLKDIERLESQEESAFLLMHTVKRVCESCSDKEIANIRNQNEYLNKLSIASKAEVEKISAKRRQLVAAIETTNEKKEIAEKEEKDLQKEIASLDGIIDELSPSLTTVSDNIDKYNNVLSGLKEDIYIIERINKYEARISESKTEKTPKAYKTEEFIPEGSYFKRFSDVYKEILFEIGYFNKEDEKLHEVEFDCDINIFDVRIDGKLRGSNGKGVRAIFHAVFKVALLIYCRRNNLFHPGLVLIDSPFVTYRDPVSKDYKYAPVEDDEIKLSKSPIKENFLNYLEKIHMYGQFIFVENVSISPSDNVEVETFYGENSGNLDYRKGFLY